MARPTAIVNRAAPLYEGFAAGHYSLPDSVLTAKRAFDTVLAADAQARHVLVPLEPDLIEARAVEAIFEAAEAGQPIFDASKPAPWTADLLAARTEKEQRDAEWRALSLARESASDRVVDTLMAEADAVTTEHLRPALEDTITLVERLRPRATGLPWESPERVIGMPTAQRTAWDAMTKAATRYEAIRRAHSTLWRLAEANDVALARFAEMRNLFAIWPTVGSWQVSTAPWPTDPRARLLWLVERNEQVQLWLPTVDEASDAMRETAIVLRQRVAGPVAYAGR